MVLGTYFVKTTGNVWISLHLCSYAEFSKTKSFRCSSRIAQKHDLLFFFSSRENCIFLLEAKYSNSSEIKNSCRFCIWALLEVPWTGTKMDRNRPMNFPDSNLTNNIYPENGFDNRNRQPWYFRAPRCPPNTSPRRLFETLSTPTNKPTTLADHLLIFCFTQRQDRATVAHRTTEEAHPHQSHLRSKVRRASRAFRARHCRHATISPPASKSCVPRITRDAN